MEESEPLLLPSPSSSDNTTPISYTPSPRPLRDLPFLLLFLLLSLSVISLGIFSISHHNPNSSTACISSNPNLNLVFSNLHQNILIWTLVSTAVLSFPFVLLLLYLLRRFAAQLVYSLLPFLILVPLALNAYWFAACTLSPSCGRAFPLVYRVLLLVFFLLLLAFLLYLLISSWHRVRLTVRILRVSASALADNLPLLAVLPALDFGFIAYVVLVFVFLVYARLNGEAVMREKEGVAYCVWKEERWVPAYYALAVITVIWAAAVVLEAQVYVISGTVAQWYFAKDGTKPSKSIRTSLRYTNG